MSTDIAPLTGNLPAAPLPFGADTAPTTGTGSANPITRLLSAIRRFKWLILAATIAGAGVGFMMTRYMPEKYVVSGYIMLEERGGNSGPVEAAGFLQGRQWIELLQNPRILDPVVRSQRLYIVGPNPGPGTPSREGPTGPDAVLFEDFDIQDQFLPGTYELAVSEDAKQWELRHLGRGPQRYTGAVGDSAGREFGLLWVPRPRQRMAGQKFKFTLLTPREVSNSVRGALGTDLATRGGRFVTVTYNATDGLRARNTLNAILRRFVTEAAVLKGASLTEQSRALDSQLFAADRRMRDAENALQNFKINTVTDPREDVAVATGLQMTTGLTYNSYFQQRTIVDSLRRERRELSQVLAAALSGELATDKMTAIGAVRNSPALGRVLGQISDAESDVRQLELVMGPEKPELLTKLNQVRQLREVTLPEYTNAVIQRLDDEIIDRESRIATIEREMRDIPERTITEGRLINEHELARSTYATVRNRAEQARLQEASSLPDVRILNEAVAPLRPSKNRKSVILFMATFAGLGAGLGLAFLLDLMDKRFRYADQITNGLGLSILGVIPEIRRAKGQQASPEEAAQVVEAFRTVRLNLSHLFPETGAIALTVTSPMPGDGKSLVSSNLALSFAESGYRTLLVDGDTRRGELHRTFGTDRRPGLLDHLTGEIGWKEALRKTSHEKLTLMPAGSRHRNAPELMGSRRMHELMAEFRANYEVVVIDSPPLAAGIDPFVLGTITGNLMMVVRAGATERDLAEAKLQILDRLPIRLLGAVLNDVRSSMEEYKYYAYSYAYGSVEEDEELAKLPATTV